MSIAYIVKQGSFVKKKQGRLLVYHDDSLVVELIIGELEQIALIGNIHITTKALVKLMDEGIDIAFMSLYGKLRGRMCSENPKNVFLRFAQYDIYNSEIRIQYAKEIVKAKIRNQKAFIGNQMQTSQYNSLFDATIAKLETTKTIDQLMGYEGIAAKEYFNLLSKTIKDMDFNKKSISSSL